MEQECHETHHHKKLFSIMQWEDFKVVTQYIMQREEFNVVKYVL